MKRIICHWSAGGHKATDLDRRHYHLLIEDDGELVRGFHSIEANESTRDGDYAAHTLNANTGSIGVAVCCMAGANEQPFRQGSAPMTRLQWETMAQVVAELCRAYRIQVTPATVLAHGEVERNLGISQRGKWDPLVLPWDTDLSKRDVAEFFRAKVAFHLEAEPDAQNPARVRTRIAGVDVADAISMNEDSFVKISDLLNALKLEIVDAEAEIASFSGRAENELFYVPYTALGGERTQLEDAVGVRDGYVSVRDLAERLNLPVLFDVAAGVMELGRAPEGGTESPPRTVTVKSGDTLSQIAERYLGSARKWSRLRRADGTAFTEASARKLRLGDVVLLPEATAPGEPTVRRALPASDGIDIEELIATAAPGLAAFARESIPVIFSECRKQDVATPAQIAYVLATAEHESKCGRFMREIWGPTAAQRGYEGRRGLGNDQRGDGFRFRGRGFVQLTGRANYRTWAELLGADILANPDLVATDASLAARILVQGMREGRFRGGHKLSDFLASEEPDFFNARDIINGDKRLFDRGQPGNRGTRIAELASRYLTVLTSGIAT
ncbi:N-acetylmuramoyl-L-alanine amidase [Sinorhizobium meliloti]|uniref:N-acetylmuramoyl-L-alanine amidase n=1 Tax=Rhizobium meliloti TaxID=382 RepID=UPI001914B234|nr:N-acetylmuramoyl-L-alanine amidase [Sinorhizobium meliloti]